MKTTILDNAYNLSLLAELGKPTTTQPYLSRLVTGVYENMFGEIVSNELEIEKASVKTRIYEKDKRGVYKGPIIKRKQKVVVTNVIRAGIQPSNVFYMNLTYLLDPKNVRQDHIMAQRIETKTGITGTNLMASKIGGSARTATVFIPDPMGATGGSVKEIIEYYESVYGPAKKYVIVHLLVTPQYLRKLQKVKAPLSVYAARKDKGLTDVDYIYPGLGGVGELINNTKK